MLLRVALLFAVSATLNSQFEDRPYFSVSSGQTFGSEAKPSVQLSAFGLKAVRIRVYRVNDAVQFMRGMPDAHQFGGAYRHGSGKMTPLERLHSWKRDLRRDIRRDLRSQFTEAPSAHLHWGEKKKPAHPEKAAYFAEAPVLNEQQLVLSFMQSVIATENRWDSQKVEIPVRSKGLYLVEVVKRETCVRTPSWWSPIS